jgi:MYXO-CTERM domain-containing protein
MATSRLRSSVLLAALLVAPAAAAAAPRLVVRQGCPGPLCPGGAPPVAAHAKGKRIVWLNFEGITLTSSNSTDDAVQDKSVILFLGGTAAGSSETIPAFVTSSLEDTGGLSRDQIIAYTLDELESIFAAYDVDFVLERPTTGNYEMIVFGGNCGSVAGTNCGGIALADCGNTSNNNITFVFPPGLDYRDLAPTAAQESAHAYGLAHTVDNQDVMYPVIQSNFFPDHFGNTDADCPSDEVEQGTTCGKSSQNSHQAMLDTIGPRGQDVYGPTVAITSHVDGGTVRVGDTIAASIADEQSGVDRVEFLINNALVDTAEDAPYEFTFPEGIDPGNVSVVLRAFDTKDNQATGRVTLYLPSGNETPCEEDADCASAELECNGEFCVPENGISELGEACEANDACATMLCGAIGDERRCSRLCNDAEPCPDGFECRGDEQGACWPSGGGGGGGCRTDGGEGLAGGPGLLALLGLGLVALRRRRAR